MSSPSNHSDSNYPEDGVSHYPKKKLKKMAKKVNYTGKHAHSHNKGGLVGELKGLMETKHYGASHRARHKMKQRLSKGEDIF